MSSFIKLITTLLALLSALYGLSADFQTELLRAESKKDTHAIIEISKRILKNDPANLTILRKLSKAQLSLGLYKQCHHTLLRLNEILKDEDAEVLNMQGTIESHHLNAEEAKRLWMKSFILDPNYILPISNLAKYYESIEDDESQYKYLKRLSELRDDPNDLAQLGRLSFVVRDWGSMQKYTTKLRKAHPNDGITKNWNPKYDKINNSREVIENLDASLLKDPKNIDLIIKRASIFNRFELDKLAILDASKAYELDSDSLFVKYNLGVIMANSGQALKAKEKLGINFNKYSYKRRHPGVKFFQELRRFEKKIRANESADDVQKIANLLHNEGQIELAYSEVNKAISIDSKCKPALYLKAKILERRNKTKASKELLKKLLVLEPNHLEALETLGRIQMSVGDFKEASQNFKVFLKIKYDKRINDLYRSCFESLQKASL